MDKGKIIRGDKPANIINDFEKHILCVYSDDNYKAKDFALKMEYVEDAYLLGEELHIVFENIEIVKNRLIEDFRVNEIKISSMKEIEPTLEDVFVNIIKNEKLRL
jgi:ABC-2 type transport system ATP-binding protein